MTGVKLLSSRNLNCQIIKKKLTVMELTVDETAIAFIDTIKPKILIMTPVKLVLTYIINVNHRYLSAFA